MRRVPQWTVMLVAFLSALGTAQARAAETVDLSGKWQGSWVSCCTGHRGTLKARFCKANDHCYRVRFSGTFFVAIPFRFSVSLNAADQGDGTVLLSGAPKLPLFGTFHFTAIATEKDFTATYSTKDDKGRFTLSR